MRFRITLFTGLVAASLLLAVGRRSGGGADEGRPAAHRRRGRGGRGRPALHRADRGRVGVRAPQGLGFARMFTGLVADTGVVERVLPRQGGARIVIRPRTLDVDALALGESVACSGACLTVVERGQGWR